MQNDQAKERANLGSWSGKLNTTFSLCVIYQRALIIPLRDRFGVEALGLPCLLALILMILWASFSHDIFMFYYTGLWLLFFMHRRVQSLRLQHEIHSQYDGWPVDAMRVCKLAPWNENMAKQIIEPLMVGFAGIFAKWFYEQRGWDPAGLPHFLIGGAVIMVFVEMAQQSAWKRRLRSLRDAQIENEQMIREFRDQY